MRKRTIVLIEDDEELAALVHDVLTTRSQEVLCAPDGRQGLALIRETIPDLVLGDFHLPETNGLDVLEQMRADEATAHIPFVFMTVDPSLPIRQRSASSGINGFLVKPFSHDELVSVVANLLHEPAGT